jgi:hypothetical protein
MLEQIKTQSGRKFEFTFPSGEHAGEHYGVEFGFCPNPICQCGIISMSVFGDKSERSERSVPSFEFSVDLIEKALDTSGEAVSKYNRNFGKAFVHYLTDEDWGVLADVHYAYKHQLLEETPDEELDTQFPIDEIEHSGTMVGFHEILPYAEYQMLEIEGRDFLLDEQYCVKPACNCSEVAVSLLDASGKQAGSVLHDFPVLFLDYKTAKWRIENTGGEDAKLLSRVAKQLNTGEYPLIFERHHNRLKSLYRLYKKRHHVSTTPIQANRKVGRNDPCPCGSGKKYKRCCLGSSSTP